MRVFLYLLWCYSWSGFSQNFENDSIRLAQPTKSLEIMATPLLFYNGIGIGFGILNKGNEHVLDINSIYMPLGPELFSVGLHYNYNRYINSNKPNFLPYIPCWLGAIRRNVDNNYEDGGPYYDKLIARIGSGFGASFLMKEKHYMRAEFGVGVAVNFEGFESYDNESAFPFKLNLARFESSNELFISPAFRLRLRYQFVTKL